MTFSVEQKLYLKQLFEPNRNRKMAGIVFLAEKCEGLVFQEQAL